MGFHPSVTFPFYQLADPLQCEVYKLAVGLLWEHTLKNDHLGVLEKLTESPIGNPIRIHRKGECISSDLAHSVRERNQMLSTMGLCGNEGLTIAELGGGNGRLAEVFGRTTNFRYAIFDITPALYVSQWYVKRLFPGEKVFEFRPFEHYSQIEQELQDSRFAFFTANQIELLPPQWCDIFININSLMEMEHRQILNFLGQIDRLTRSHFFSQQWVKWRNETDRITVAKDDFKLGSRMADCPGYAQ